MFTRPWFNHYPPFVPQTINTAVYTSLTDLFEQTCRLFATRSAVSNFGSHLSFAKLYRLSGYFAAWLQQAAGLKRGDRFALMLPNSLQYYVAIMGALQAGLVVVNINPLYTATELTHQLQDSGCTAILVMANFAHTLEAALTHTPLKQVIVTELGDLFGLPKAIIFNGVAKYIKKTLPAWHIPQAISFNKLMKCGKKLPLHKLTFTHQDVAFLQYTGGTTGTAKGAMLTHGNLLANTEQATAWIKSSGLEEGKEVMVAPLPLYHVFSLTVCVFCFLKLGGTAVLVTNPRDIRGFIKLLAKTPYSVMVGIDTLFGALLQQPDFNRLSFKSLKLVITGGMPLQQRVADRWRQLTGVAILQGYGLTEASPIVTISPPSQAEFRGSIGLPIPSTDIEIRDEHNQEVPMGDRGELCVSGPQVMREYWQSPEESRLAFTPDGWLKTGDIAYFDAQGFLYIVDRIKNMILVSGFKVYPNEIEKVIAKHPKVAAVAVVGIPSSTSGEAIKALVVSQDPTLSAEEIIYFCRQSLTGYKIPRTIEFVQELPVSPLGKILRRKLRETA